MANSDQPVPPPLIYTALPKAAAKLISGESEGKVNADGRSISLPYTTLRRWIKGGLVKLHVNAVGVEHVDVREVRKVLEDRKDRPLGRPPKRARGD